MSLANVRAALEIALNAMSPALSTAWEGQYFSPQKETPWQRVRLRLLTPDNSALGPSYFQERGALLVELHYPLGKGPKLAEARADMLRTAFKRGSSFANGGVTVGITRTPAIGNALEDNEFSEYIVPVTIPFKVDIFL